MNDTDDANKPCLKCSLKHILNSKTYLMEAIQFGFKTSVTVEELNKIILVLVDCILKQNESKI